MTHLRLASLLAATLLGCATVQSPRVEHVPTRPAALRNASVSYAVWTPPDFSPEEELPLVVFLHGGGDDPGTFERNGLADRLGQAVQEGRIPRVVMVLPQGDDGFWMNWYDGTRHYEDWIVDHVVPEVVERWHTRACPEDCHVMGVSMGGYGSIRFALDRPERFSSVSSLSGPIFNAVDMHDFSDNRLFAIMIPMNRIFGPTEPVTRLRNEDVYQRWRSASDVGMPVFIAWGSNDRAGLERSNERFAEHLAEQRIPHHAYEFEGDHSWVSWAPVIEEALRVQVGGAPMNHATFEDEP